MKIISITGLPKSGKTTTAKAIGAALFADGRFMPVLLDGTDKSEALRRVCNCLLEEQKDLEITGKWRERVCIIDGVNSEDELHHWQAYGCTALFVSSARRLKVGADDSLAGEYEFGHLPDTLFDFTVSNNDPAGLPLFEKKVGELGLTIVTTAREEIR